MCQYPAAKVAWPPAAAAAGTFACPKVMSPQQATRPAVVRMHVWLCPVTSVARPASFASAQTPSAAACSARPVAVVSSTPAVLAPSSAAAAAGGAPWSAATPAAAMRARETAAEASERRGAMRRAGGLEQYRRRATSGCSWTDVPGGLLCAFGRGGGDSPGESVTLELTTGRSFRRGESEYQHLPQGQSKSKGRGESPTRAIPRSAGRAGLGAPPSISPSTEAATRARGARPSTQRRARSAGGRRAPRKGGRLDCDLGELQGRARVSTAMSACDLPRPQHAG